MKNYTGKHGTSLINIEDANLFCITDVLFCKGDDVRLNKFYTQVSSKKENRFDYMLQIYKEAINISKYVDNGESEKATRFVISKLASFICFIAFIVAADANFWTPTKASELGVCPDDILLIPVTS